MYMFDSRNPLYIKPSGDGISTLACFVVAAIVVIGVFLWLGCIEPAMKRKKLLEQIEEAERLAREEATRMRWEAEKARKAAEAEKERRKAAEKAARIEANKMHVEDLTASLEAKLELARATQAKADREKDEYKRIQLIERATRLYVQANNIEAKIKKLSE